MDLDISNKVLHKCMKRIRDENLYKLFLAEIPMMTDENKCNFEEYKKKQGIDKLSKSKVSKRKKLNMTRIEQINKDFKNGKMICHSETLR